MPNRTERYLYRCSRDSLMTHLKHIEESGDTVEWPVYMGEQGFWLICRKADTRGSLAGSLSGLEAKMDHILETVAEGAKRGTERGKS